MSGVINTVTGVLGTTVSSPRACFELCAGTSDAYYVPYLLGGNTLSPRYGCSCGDETVVSGSPSYCGLGSFYAYSHPAAAAASSLPRRKRAIERIQAQKRSEMIRERQWDCPTGMNACNVNGVANSWEVSLLSTAWLVEQLTEQLSLVCWLHYRFRIMWRMHLRRLQPQR